jgi:hypothetical protein
MKFLVVVFAVCAAVVSAEAEAEADASAQFYGGYGYAGVSPYAYRPYASAYYGGYSPLAYGYGGLYGAGYGYGYNAYGYGGHFIGKREAEAEPEADAQIALGYATLPYAYTPYHYAPYWYAPAASSYQYKADPFHVESVSQSHPTAALHVVGKREAEAAPEADAQIALAYAGLPYAYARPVGVAAHPGYPYASAYEYRSPQGLNAYAYRPWGAYYGYF